MGAKVSIPERVYRAAKDNDVAELQALCQDMRLNSALDADTRHALLNWRDEEGRTALQWACQKNHLHVAQILLEQGADIHAIAPKRREGGSPLAEAVAGRHEALVDLLLRYGADPFTENPGGKTPMDLALEGRAVNILRACERTALFAGYVNTRVMQLKGLATAPKDRWVVIVPRFTPPPPGGSLGEVRVMMLAYRNAAEAEPRTRVWLDGAALYVQGGEAVLRLHANHVQPRNIYTRYEGGWTMFFRPAQAPGVVPAGGPPAAHSPEATFAAFLATSSRPLEQLQQQQQARLAAAAASPWPAQPAAARIAPIAQQQQQQPAAAPYPGVPGPYSQQQPQPQQPQQQQQQQPYVHHAAGQQMQPARAPPAGSTQAADTTINARPGESDEDFARRLAAMFGEPVQAAGATGGSAASTAPPSRATSGTAPGGQQQPQQQSGGGGSNPFLAQQQQQQQQQASSNPFLAHGATITSGGGGGGGGAQAAAPPEPQPTAAAAPPAPPAAAAAAEQPAPVPSAPPASAASAAAPADLDAADADMCVICLSAAREVGLLHGSSVHKCLCKECAGMVRVGSPCPMCRQSIERILGVF